MKLRNIKYLMAALLVGASTVSCEDFLDRPTEDSPTVKTYYETDDQCISGVNYLYNSPWYDFQRGFFKVGEVLSGNYYWGSSPYLTFTVNSTDEDLRNMSYSLWAVNGHASSVYNNIQASVGPSESVKNQTMGECLLWKAMAYFYLVRTFGDVPIIHDLNSVIEEGSYNEQYKVQKADVYEYIIMTLEKAIELLPKQCSKGRLDKYCAKGLLAKVYLTKAGVSGKLNNDDLQKAADYAKDVIDNSGRGLMENYADIFRLKNNTCDENMIAWRWTADGENWTRQNSLQSDLAMVGFDEFGDCWGGYGGPSIDLQEAFGVKPTENPASRSDGDARRKATMMMAGDVYEYFWQDKGGFDYLKFIYNVNPDGYTGKDPYGKGGPGKLQSPTGANEVKHLYGNAADHLAATGVSAMNMASSLCTPILRLADVYLVFVEAKVLLDGGTTTDTKALKVYGLVRGRSVPSYWAKENTSVTFADVWKERRLELACEGDRWYDFVRLSYYDTKAAIDEIKMQKRNAWWNLDKTYETYAKNSSWSVNEDECIYDNETARPNVTASSFTIPFPQEDLVFNSHLSEDAIHVDVRATYSY